MKARSGLGTYLLLVMCGLLVPCLAGAAIRYVAKDGSDANNGQQATPWLTVQYAVTLADGSPCIDSGAKTGLAVDLVGVERLLGHATDMGAYEYNPPWKGTVIVVH